MATIAQIVEQIRHAVFGKDVRENIAQGIEKCYADSTASAQIERIIEKGEETIESIPDDYTELSEDVSEVKQSIPSCGIEKTEYGKNLVFIDDAISGVLPIKKEDNYKIRGKNAFLFTGDTRTYRNTTFVVDDSDNNNIFVTANNTDQTAWSEGGILDLYNDPSKRYKVHELYKGMTVHIRPYIKNSNVSLEYLIDHTFLRLNYITITESTGEMGQTDTFVDFDINTNEDFCFYCDADSGKYMIFTLRLAVNPGSVFDAEIGFYISVLPSENKYIPYEHPSEAMKKYSIIINKQNIKLSYYSSSNKDKSRYNKIVGNPIIIDDAIDCVEPISISEGATIYSRNMFRINAFSRRNYNGVNTYVSPTDPNEYIINGIEVNNIGYSDTTMTIYNINNRLPAGTYYLAIYTPGIDNPNDIYLYVKTYDPITGVDRGPTTYVKNNAVCQFIINEESYVAVRIAWRIGFVANNQHVKVYWSIIPPDTEYVPYKYPSNDLLYSKSIILFSDKSSNKYIEYYQNEKICNDITITKSRDIIKYINPPEYYNDYMLKRYKAINNVLDTTLNVNAPTSPCDCSQFIFFTDYHYDGGGLRFPKVQDNTKNTPALMYQLTKNVPVEFIVHGGDILNSSTFAGQEELFMDLADYKNSFDSVWNMMFNCIGNHEYYSEDPPTWLQLFDTLNGHNLFKIKDIDNYGDFYFDIDLKKIRCFCIGSCSRSYTTDMINTEQKKWIMRNLENIPSGYTVILFSHVFGGYTVDDTTHVVTANTNTNSVEIAAAINAFVNRSTYSFDNETYNYSNVNADFACVMFGHSHVDASAYLASGVPIIMTGADSALKGCGDYNEETHSFDDRSKYIGTIYEQLFDVVTLDKVNHRIICTRIGYGSDRSFTYPSTIN